MLQDKMTSEQWQKQFPDVQVYDPDGWDRKNFQYSWYEEEITQEEYQNRVLNSTCLVKKIKRNNERKEEK